MIVRGCSILRDREYSGYIAGCFGFFFGGADTFGNIARFLTMGFCVPENQTYSTRYIRLAVAD